MVLYDEDCGICSWLAWRLERADGISVAAIGSREGEVRLRDLGRDARYANVHVVDAIGRRRSGGEAIPALLRALPGGRPLAALAAAHPALTAWGYRLVARNRRALSRLTGVDGCATHVPAAHRARAKT
jgi:predicted DCC family thiol-disulfide oxidoreductase YuxK